MVLIYVLISKSACLQAICDRSKHVDYNLYHGDLLVSQLFQQEIQDFVELSAFFNFRSANCQNCKIH